MVTPKVYADFHNADSNGHLRLNCVGTIEGPGPAGDGVAARMKFY